MSDREIGSNPTGVPVAKLASMPPRIAQEYNREVQPFRRAARCEKQPTSKGKGQQSSMRRAPALPLCPRLPIHTPLALSTFLSYRAKGLGPCRRRRAPALSAAPRLGARTVRALRSAACSPSREHAGPQEVEVEEGFAPPTPGPGMLGAAVLGARAPDPAAAPPQSGSPDALPGAASASLAVLVLLGAHVEASERPANSICASRASGVRAPCRLPALVACDAMAKEKNKHRQRQTAGRQSAPPVQGVHLMTLGLGQEQQAACIQLSVRSA